MGQEQYPFFTIGCAEMSTQVNDTGDQSQHPDWSKPDKETDDVVFEDKFKGIPVDASTFAPRELRRVRVESKGKNKRAGINFINRAEIVQYSTVYLKAASGTGRFTLRADREGTTDSNYREGVDVNANTWFRFNPKDINNNFNVVGAFPAGDSAAVTVIVAVD